MLTVVRHHVKTSPDTREAGVIPAGVGEAEMIHEQLHDEFVL